MNTRLLLLVPALVSLLLGSCHSVARSVAPVTRASAGSAVRSVSHAVVPNAGQAASLRDVWTGDYWPADGRFPGLGRVSSWPQFRQHNAQRRALFAAERAHDQNGIVFVGDSITEGWHTLRQDFADLGVKVVNRGIGGDTTPNLLYRLQDDVLSLHPRGLVILIGTNDLGEHTPPADIAANLAQLHRRIRAAYPRILIAWCLVMPRGDGPQYPAEVRRLNERIRRLAATDSRITVCDTFTPLATPQGTDNPQDFHPDNLHPNAAGYVVWRAALHPILARWHLDEGNEGVKE